MKNKVGRKKDSIENNTLVIHVDEMKSMFIKGGLKRLSSPTCRVPALDSARVNRPLNVEHLRLSDRTAQVCGARVRSSK